MILAAPPGFEESPQQLVSGLLSAEIVDKDTQQPVASLFSALEQERTAVAGTFRRNALASRLLPALTDLEFAVDVRFQFEKDEITAAVPVALVHIDTDAAHAEIWFQMNRAQVEKAITDLTKVARQMDTAGKWVEGRQ